MDNIYSLLGVYYHIYLLSFSLQCTCVHNPEPELATLRRPHTRCKERAQPDRLVLTASKEKRNSADFILVRQICNFLGWKFHY